MGTRHLIIVYHEGNYKLAQYGQWDGYPEGQGVKVLDFVSDPDKVARLTRNLDKLYSPTQEECNEINNRANSFQLEATSRLQQLEAQGLTLPNEEYDNANEGALRPLNFTCPSLSRDTSAGILDLIADAEKPVPVQNSLTFIADGLFCEWAYLIDLDSGVLEAYKGRDGPGGTGGGTRFDRLELAEACEGAGLQAVLRGSWELRNLPNQEAFMRACLGAAEEQNAVD